MTTLSEALLEWRLRGRLDPPNRPTNVPPIPPFPATSNGLSSKTSSSMAFAGPAAAVAVQAAKESAERGAVSGMLRVVPAAGETATAGATATEGAALGRLAFLGPVGAFLAAMLYSSPTAPAWMDELNPITGLGYANQQEYQWVRKLTPIQIDFLHKLWENPTPVLQPSPAPQPQPLPQKTAKTRNAPDPKVQVSPDGAADSQKRTKRKILAYPLLWPLTKLPPPLVGNFMQIYFVRTKSSRDKKLAQTLQKGKWIRAHDAGIQGKSLVAHHVIPLFLGGADLPSNVILWNTLLHIIGHDWLNWQPQMLHPPPPLPPLESAELFKHPYGTLYKLVGFKVTRGQTTPSLP